MKKGWRGTVLKSHSAVSEELEVPKHVTAVGLLPVSSFRGKLTLSLHARSHQSQGVAGQLPTGAG